MVEPDGHRHDVGHPRDERRVAHRSRPHHDAGDPGDGKSLGIGNGAHATTGLHRRLAGHRGDDAGDDGPVDGIAGAGGVEVDDVDPAGTGVGERAGDRHRVVAVHRLLVVVALQQAHRTAGAQVDGGVQVDHRIDHRPGLTRRRRRR